MMENHEIPLNHHPFLSSSSENNIEQSIKYKQRVGSNQMNHFAIYHKDINSTKAIIFLVIWSLLVTKIFFGVYLF